MKTKKGFTLIELLVVIAIIAILSAIGLVALNGAREKARDAQRRSDIAQLRTALSLYYDDNGSKYPNTESEGPSTAIATDNVRDQSNNSSGAGATPDGADAGAVPGVLTNLGSLTTNYLAQALKGPTSNGTDQDRYFYVGNTASTAATPITSATSYVVYTRLEAAGGDKYYAINEQGTVYDLANNQTAAPDCDNTATPVCGY